jgi:hypothetical protein
MSKKNVTVIFINSSRIALHIHADFMSFSAAFASDAQSSVKITAAVIRMLLWRPHMLVVARRLNASPSAHLNPPGETHDEAVEEATAWSALSVAETMALTRGSIFCTCSNR